MEKICPQKVKEYQRAKVRFLSARQTLILEIMESLIANTESMSVSEGREFVHQLIDSNCEVEELRAEVTRLFEEYISNRIIRN